MQSVNAAQRYCFVEILKLQGNILVVSVLLIFLVFCVVFYCFVCIRPVSCVPNAASFFGLFILDCPFGFL